MKGNFSASSLTPIFNVETAFDSKPRITLKEIAAEPFRVFFPAGVLAGIIGVLLWPLYFWHVTDFYPGQTHPRLMVFGMFGAFIFGFLGTAMPRMLSAQPFRVAEILPLVVIHTAMVLSFFASKLLWGDVLFFAALCVFIFCIALRIPQRKDIPPPGFILVALSFICVSTGTLLAIVQYNREVDAFWMVLQKLLVSQGFVLLPILGIGPFLLPRFLGMSNPHDFPETLVPSQDWIRKAVLAMTVGVIVVGTFVAEASGWMRTAHAVRFIVTLAYLFVEMPLHRAPKAKNALGLCIRLSLFALLTGFLTVPLFPAFRVSLLHLTLVGGFAVLMFVVATRVVFGHSGNLALLKGRNRWLIIAVGLMLFGMTTRMSGDFWPKVMASHYVYGAIAWIAGVILWSVYVLPKVFIVDREK